MRDQMNRSDVDDSELRGRRRRRLLRVKGSRRRVRERGDRFPKIPEISRSGPIVSATARAKSRPGRELGVQRSDRLNRDRERTQSNPTQNRTGVRKTGKSAIGDARAGDETNPLR